MMEKCLSDNHIPFTDQEIITNFTGYTQNSVANSVGKENVIEIQVDVGKESLIELQVDFGEENRIVPFEFLDAANNYNETEMEQTRYYIELSYANCMRSFLNLNSWDTDSSKPLPSAMISTSASSTSNFNYTALIESNCEDTLNVCNFKYITKLCSSRYPLSVPETVIASESVDALNTADQVKITSFELVDVSGAMNQVGASFSGTKDQAEIALFKILVKLIFASNFGSENNDVPGVIVVTKRVFLFAEMILKSESIVAYYSRRLLKLNGWNTNSLKMALSEMILKSELIVAFDDVDASIKLDRQRVHDFYNASSDEDEFSFLCAISRDFANFDKNSSDAYFSVSSAHTPHSLHATHESSEDLVSPYVPLTLKIIPKIKKI